LVIHAMDAFAGAIGVSDSDGKATPVYSACVPRDCLDTVDPYFYAYYMRHIALSGLLVALAKGDQGALDRFPLQRLRRPEAGGSLASRTTRHRGVSG
jgi:hypothetical protein